MGVTRWLGLAPFVAMLAGLVFFNRSTPFVLGAPLLLAWMVGCVLLTSLVMGTIYLLDPANREGGGR